MNFNVYNCQQPTIRAGTVKYNIRHTVCLSAPTYHCVCMLFVSVSLIFVVFLYHRRMEIGNIFLPTCAFWLSRHNKQRNAQHVANPLNTLHDKYCLYESFHSYAFEWHFTCNIDANELKSSIDRRNSPKIVQNMKPNFQLYVVYFSESGWEAV